MGVFWMILGCLKGHLFKTKVLEIGKTPPPFGENSQKITLFFWRAPLIYSYEIKLYKYYTNEYSYRKWHEYLNICHTLPEYDFDTNEYLNIFISRKRYKRISEFIGIEKINTNQCSNIFITLWFGAKTKFYEMFNTEPRWLSPYQQLLLIFANPSPLSMHAALPSAIWKQTPNPFKERCQKIKTFPNWRPPPPLHGFGTVPKCVLCASGFFLIFNAQITKYLM